MLWLCAVYPYVEFLDFLSVKLSNGAFTLKSISKAETLEDDSLGKRIFFLTGDISIFHMFFSLEFLLRRITTI